jgi:hypothetical protein
MLRYGRPYRFVCGKGHNEYGHFMEVGWTVGDEGNSSGDPSSTVLALP